MIVVGIVFLVLAGCTRHSYQLRGYDAALLTLAEKPSVPTQLVTPERLHDEVVGRPLAPLGKVAKQPHFRRASYLQAEELPTPPPVGRVVAEELETPPPTVATNDRDLVVVAVPPRPPGLLKRVLGLVKRSHGVECDCDACAPAEATVPLSIETPLFSRSGELYPPNRWWISFSDLALNRQVESSLGGSFTLAVALQRLRAAQALARREASNLWPDVNGFSEAEGTFRTFAPNDGFFALGLQASYEVDLWGRIHSRVEAEQFRASATAEDYHAVALTLSAEIARTWFTLVEANAQLDVLNEQLTTNITGLKLQEARFGGGDERVGSADVLRQRQLVESTREQLIIARSRIDVLEHRLAVLQGRPPQEATYDVGRELPTLPPLPATGLPSELVQRRPDVRRDYLAICSADRDLAAAIRDQYPRLNLASSLTTLADSSANLFRDWILVVAGQLIGPILDGGQRRAEVDRTAAVMHQLVDEYGQTVLIAFSEVEDALALERYQRERIESLIKQYELAEQAWLQLSRRYFRFGDEIGETEYLDVLTATTTKQQLQRDLLSARLDLILTRVALYVALAGSFDPHPQVIADDLPPGCASDEPPFETRIIPPLDSHPDLSDRLRMHSRGRGGDDRGDLEDRADRTADRGDTQVGGAR